jgi:hypothetical protein
MPALARPHPPAPVPARTLVTFDARRPAPAAAGHDRVSRSNVARRLAAVMGCAFGDEYVPGADLAAPLYFVPHDALLAADARRLGITGPARIFGGVVPHAFVATKAITHPLVDGSAVAPAGWSHAFARAAGDAVLRGFTTFCVADARRAALALLREGPVRIKCVSGIGGSGQHVARDEAEVAGALASIAATEFDGAGVAVEEHLADAVTFSVGCVECGGTTIAYCGTQRETRNHHGHDVYGGSTLDVVRGDFAALLAHERDDDRRAAVRLARTYDAAAFAAYPEAYASRRNYDVLFGRDAAGRRRAGVLEQSWRIGGASGAEVLALAALARAPARDRVRCATVEVYDDRCPVPAGAFVYYRGIDARVGALTKYACATDDHDAR